MTADPKVSPRPWIIRPRCDGALDIVNDSGCIAHVTRFESGKFITGGVSEANAAHIVRCVNAHDGLVEALAGLAPILEAAESNASGNPEWEWVSKRINAARAALAAAKEGATTDGPEEAMEEKAADFRRDMEEEIYGDL